MDTTTLIELIGAIIAFVLGGGGLFVFLKKRQRPSDPTQLIINRPGVDPIAPLPYIIPEWISQLKTKNLATLYAATNTGVISDLSDVDPTVLIGVGPAGREVLAQVAKILDMQYGSHIFNKVRLLQIDVTPRREDKSKTINSDETNRKDIPLQYQVSLQLDVQEVRDSLQRAPRDWPHWQWYKDCEPDYERANGRMGLFSDLQNGADNSILWKTIQRAFAGLENPAIRMISSTFDDVGSGMLPDLARIIQLTFHQQANLDIQLWLTGPVGRDWSPRFESPNKTVSKADQISRSLATFRELQFFQRNLKISYQYVTQNSSADTFQQAYFGGVVQTLVLFEPMPKESSKPEQPNNDVFVCMADSLCGLTYKEVNDNFKQLLNGRRSQASTKVNQNKIEGTLCGIGCYTLRAPRQEIIKAIAWRMLRDVLFEFAIGIFPNEKYVTVGGVYHPKTDETQDDFNLDYRFPSTRERRDEITEFIEKFDQQLETESFLSHVRHNLVTILNGKRNKNRYIGRSGAIKYAIGWLDTLARQLDLEDAKSVAGHLRSVKEQLIRYQNWFQESVWPQCIQNHESAQQQLKQLRLQTARYAGLDETLEGRFYKEKIRPWLDAPSFDEHDRLIQLANSFGWDVRLNAGRLQIALIALGKEFNWETHGEHNICDFEITLDKTGCDQLFHHLYILAEQLAQVIDDQTIWNMATAQDINEWIRRAAPRIQFHENTASKEMGELNTTAVFIGPRSDLTSQLYRRIAEMPELKGKANEYRALDPYAMSLIRMTDWIPMETLLLMDEGNRAEHSVPPNLYVWRQQQLAGKIETKMGNTFQFSPQFCAWLEEDEEWLKTLAKAFLYKIFYKDEIYSWMLDIEDREGINERMAKKNLGEILRLFWSDRKELGKSITQAIDVYYNGGVVDAPTFKEINEKQVIDSHDKDPIARDFDYYCEYYRTQIDITFKNKGK